MKKIDKLKALFKNRIEILKDEQLDNMYLTLETAIVHDGLNFVMFDMYIDFRNWNKKDLCNILDDEGLSYKFRGNSIIIYGWGFEPDLRGD